jgi:phosphoribosyl-AMP cyclohydrolase
MSEEIESGSKELLDFEKLSKIASKGQSVLPVVVQHVDSREVLILAYANREALLYSLQNRVAAFWSTSRNELWVKGATSGDTLELVEIRLNCEQNSLLYLVRPKTGGVCHTKNAKGVARSSCYYRRIRPDGSLEFLPGTE